MTWQNKGMDLSFSAAPRQSILMTGAASLKKKESEEALAIAMATLTADEKHAATLLSLGKSQQQISDEMDLFPHEAAALMQRVVRKMRAAFPDAQSMDACV